MLIRQHSKLILSLLLLLASVLPFLPSATINMIGTYRYKDTVLFASLGFSLCANFLLAVLGGLSVVSAIKERSFLDSLVYVAFTLLSVVPVGIVVYLLAKMNFLVNPG